MTNQVASLFKIHKWKQKEGGQILTYIFLPKNPRHIPQAGVVAAPQLATLGPPFTRGSLLTFGIFLPYDRHMG